MSTNHHTVIASGAAADDTVVNSPLGELDSAITQGELYSAIDIRTISGGVVTLTGGWHSIAAETGTTDDLDTITQAGGAATPQIIVIQADTGDTITLKHNADNIQLSGSEDCELSASMRLMLFYDGSNWRDIVSAPRGWAVTNYTGGSWTETSSAFNDVDATNATLTIITTGRPVVLHFSGALEHSVGDNFVDFDIDTDGALEGGTNGVWRSASGAAGVERDFSFSYLISGLAPGSHTFKLNWRTEAATATLYATAAMPFHFAAYEI
jgi:hypothetical protein